MARLRVERVIEADPTSAALLLAGPGAVELWPTEPGPTGAVTITAFSPRRTPMAHVAEFDLRGPALPPARGVLTLTYEPGPGPTRSPAHRTSALLRLDYPALGRGTVLDRVRAARALRQLAEGFLDNLTQAAEQRSYAA